MSGAPPKATYRWGLAFRWLWIAVFTPFLVGFLVAGILGHWVFLVAFALWAAALVCVSRAEMLNTRARGMDAPNAGLLGARAGWLLVAIVLILASGIVIRLVLGAE